MRLRLEVDLGGRLDRRILILVEFLLGKAHRAGEKVVGEGLDTGIQVAGGGIVITARGLQFAFDLAQFRLQLL